MMMTNNNLGPRREIVGSPSMECLQKSACITNKKDPMKYTFLDIYGGRLKTKIISEVEICCYTAKFIAEVLDFSDKKIDTIQVEINTALKIGLYSYIQ